MCDAAPKQAPPRVPVLPSLTADELARVDAALHRIGVEPMRTVMPVVDHYTVLGLAADFSAEDLKKAYKKMSRITHPDKNGGSNARFQMVAAAHELLSDPEARQVASVRCTCLCVYAHIHIRVDSQGPRDSSGSF